MRTSRESIKNFIISKRNPATSIQAIRENALLNIICNMHENIFFDEYDEHPSVDQLTDIVFGQISSFENYNG